MRQERGDLPSIGDLLRSTQETKRSVEEFVENDEDREQKMLLVMSELEKINEKGAPRLYVTIGEGDERLILSTVPVLNFDEESSKEDVSYALTQPEVIVIRQTVYETEVFLPVVTKRGYFVLDELGAVISIDKKMMNLLQNPLLPDGNDTRSTLTDFQSALRARCDMNTGQVLDAEMNYFVRNGETIPRVKFGKTWKGQLGKIVEYPFELKKINPEDGVEMLLETQEIYRNAIETRNEENKKTSNAAIRLIATFNEKRKRGKTKN